MKEDLFDEILKRLGVYEILNGDKCVLPNTSSGKF